MSSRVGDLGSGTCPHHSPVPLAYTTVFASGANTVLVNGEPATYVSTIGISSCGHVTLALNGSSLVKMNGLGDHRIGDLGANYGTYVVISGSPNVTCS